MKVELKYPPNIEKIISKFGDVVKKKGTLFTYGDTIFNPSAVEMPEWIMSHEQVHSDRQLVHGAEYWWDKYLKDAEFRYEEELVAHIREYQIFCAYANSRNERRLGLKQMSKRLSSNLYGNCVNFETARYEIKNG